MQIDRRASNIYEQLETMLSSAQIGDIASDHKAELQGFNGWNYVAITAVAKQATRSLIYVYDDANPDVRERRKALRLKYGHEWRKAMVREHQGRVVEATHPLVKLLKRPNPTQSGGSFRWEMIQQMRLHGSAIVFNRPSFGGKTCERYVIPMALITPIKPGRYRHMPMGGITINPSSWNSFMFNSGSEVDQWSSLQQFMNVEIPVSRLTIVKYPHPHFKGDGASPTNAASRWIDAGTIIDRSRVEFYQEGPNGKILITIEGEHSPEHCADLEDKLGRSLGPDGPRVTVVANGTAILSKRTADEMDYTSGSEQMRDGVLAAQGVPKSMVGLGDGMTYGSLAASILGATMLAVQPDMDLIADEETLDIAREYGETLCVEYEVPAINDPELEDRRLEMDSKVGVMTVGEYRMKRGETMFGNAYDDYIMTANGNVPMASLLQKPELAVPSDPYQQEAAPSSIPKMPSMAASETPIGDFEKQLRFDQDSGEILIDETLLDAIDRTVLDAFEGAGFTFRGLMDAQEKEVTESASVWTWADGIDHQSFVKSLPPTPRLAQLTKALEAVEEERTEHEYGCVLFLVPDDMKKKFLTEVHAIPSKVIAEEQNLELEPHVTALYGILGISLDEVVRIVAGLESPLVKFGKTSSFPGGDHGVPLFVSVESDDMHNINTKLRSLLPHTVGFPEYTPHATLAYVTDAEGLANTRCSLTGKSCYLTTAIVSMPGKDKVVVPLRRPFVQGDLMPFAKQPKET